MRILDRIFDRILDDVADRIASRIDDIHEARAGAALAAVPDVDDDRYTALELDLIAARNRGGRPHA